jgi:diketogulonate reductase-like aldo/keto reductase
MIGGLFRFVSFRLFPLVVVGVAIFLGWLNTYPIPEGTLFSMFYPIVKGYVPPVLSGGFKVCPVPPLPEGDFSLEPRPEGETFIALAGLDDEEEEERDAKIKAFQMPQQGLGMCCRYTAYDKESVKRTILWYLKLGGRHIDTADLYQNHQWIGEALQIAMKDYKIPREEIFVTTKLWVRSYGSTAPQEAVTRMLQELQLEYIDLVLMHAPRHIFKLLGKKTECDEQGWTPKQCRVETWKALSKIRATGQVHHIGVSNFVIHQLQELQDLGDSVAPIAVNQFQYNPFMPDYAHETFWYCMRSDIAVTAWSSFSGTALQHSQAMTVKTLTKIANAHDTTVAQILLKWAMQKGAIVIPGTGNPKHMAENLNAFQIELSDKEMTQIDDLRNDESAKKFFNQPPDDS